MCSSDLSGVLGEGVAGQVIVPLNSAPIIGEVGSVTADREVALTGVASSGAVGSVALGDRNLPLSSVSAQGFVGSLIAVYWKDIDDSQFADWMSIVTSQTPAWQTMDDTQTSNWQNINNPQVPGWSLVDDEQTPNWEEIEVTT